MYYCAITIATKPGARWAGVDHLKKLAKWMTDKYGLPTQVLGNVAGPIYQNHIVSRYESMAQIEEIQAKIYADPEFTEWFQGSGDLLAWQEATNTIYEAFE